MAGLALGSWVLGRYADRSKNPLRFYGLLEIGIGISATLVPLIFRALDNVYWAAAPSLSAIPGMTHPEIISEQHSHDQTPHLTANWFIACKRSVGAPMDRPEH